MRKPSHHHKRTGDSLIDIDAVILQEGRDSERSVVIAAVILEINGTDHLTFYTDEYGDGDGEEHVLDFIERASKYLKPGERLRAARFEITELPAEKPLQARPIGAYKK